MGRWAVNTWNVQYYQSYLRLRIIGPNPQAEILRPNSDKNLKSHNCLLDMSRLWYQQIQYKDVKQISSCDKQGNKKVQDQLFRTPQRVRLESLSSLQSLASILIPFLRVSIIYQLLTMISS